MFPWFPYTNFHRLNADWLLKKMKEMEEAVTNATSGIPALRADVDRLSTLVNEHIPQSAREFAAIRQDLSGLQTSFDTFTASTADSIGLINQRISEVNTALGDRITSVEGRVTALENAPSSIKTFEAIWTGNPTIITNSATKTAIAEAYNALSRGEGAAMGLLSQNEDQDLPNYFKVHFTQVTPSTGAAVMRGTFMQPKYVQSSQLPVLRIYVVSVTPGSNTVDPTIEIDTYQIDPL